VFAQHEVDGVLLLLVAEGGFEEAHSGLVDVQQFALALVYVVVARDLREDAACARLVFAQQVGRIAPHVEEVFQEPLLDRHPHLADFGLGENAVEPLLEHLGRDLHLQRPRAVDAVQAIRADDP